MGQSVSQMVNVIMSQDSGENRQSAGLSGHTLDSVLTNGASLLSEVNVLSSPGTDSMPTPTHDLQTQPVTFKREIMDTEVNPF